MEEIHELANKMRESLSEYCANECGCFCCKKGYITLTPEQVELVCGEHKDKLIQNGDLIELWDGKFSMKFQNCLGGCPQLKNMKCLIHDNEKRPATCKDFPIFINGKEIKISSRCPAKADNKFYEFEIQAKKLGYMFVESFFEI